MLLKDLAKKLDGVLIGDPECYINGIEALDKAKAGFITCIFEPKYFTQINTSPASAFLVPQKIAEAKNQIVVKNPRKALAQIISLFYPHPQKAALISDKSQIDPTAKLGKNINIGPFTSIGANTSIKQNCNIFANVTIGENCSIGENVTIYPQVVIYDNTVIGNNVILHAGAVIGSDGFGYYPNKEKWGKIPHIGQVIIEDDVEIGANSCVDRGCLDKTLIGQGTKIDNLCHIAHNNIIGQNCAVAGLTGFSGGVTLGNHVMVAGQAGFNGHIKIGNNVVVLGRAGVSKDIKDNEVISGFPAYDHKKDIEDQIILRRLIKEYRKKNK